MSTSKEPIRLRRRKTSKGLTSLYLDIYLNGKRSYEYLKLYLVPEKSREDKQKNKETLKLAEAIRAKRVVELQNGEFGFKSQFKEDTLFFDYYEAMCEKRFKAESYISEHYQEESDDFFLTFHRAGDGRSPFPLSPLLGTWRPQ